IDVARRFRLSVDALLAVNPHVENPCLAGAGRRITLPRLPVGPLIKERRRGRGLMVWEGESLQQPAERAGIDAQRLMALTPHNLESERLPAGLCLALPDGGPVLPGALAAVTLRDDGCDVALLDLEGNLLTWITAGGFVREIAPPVWSPGGGMMAFVGQDDAVWLAEPTGRPPRRIASGAYAGSALAWSPDGSALAFDGPRDIFLLDLGTGERRLWVNEAASPSWFPDGGRMLYTSLVGPTAQTMAISRGGKPERLIDEERSQLFPRISPDGVRLLYTAPDEGRVYLRDLAGGWERAAEAPGGGCGGRYSWSPDGAHWVDIAVAHSERTPYPTGLMRLFDREGRFLRVLAELKTPYGAGGYAWHPSGDGLVFTSCSDGDPDLWYVDREGKDLRRLT